MKQNKGLIKKGIYKRKSVMPISSLELSATGMATMQLLQSILNIFLHFAIGCLRNVLKIVLCTYIEELRMFQTES